MNHFDIGLEVSQAKYTEASRLVCRWKATGFWRKTRPAQLQNLTLFLISEQAPRGRDRAIPFPVIFPVLSPDFYTKPDFGGTYGKTV